MDAFMDRMSGPLKKMQVEYLTQATNNCYKEQHLSDSFTNYEQILICKEAERQKVFNKFEKMLVSHRDSSNHYQLSLIKYLIAQFKF